MKSSTSLILLRPVSYRQLDEHWKTLTACLHKVYFVIVEETKPLQLAAGFKFESKFEPLQIHDSSLLLFQKAVTSFECKIKLLSSWIGAAL